MGNQVQVGILTDHWSDIKKDPQGFVDVIDMMKNGTYLLGDYNKFHATVLPYHHADFFRLMFAWRNVFGVISPTELIRKINKYKQHGGDIKDYIKYVEQIVSHAEYELRHVKQELKRLKPKKIKKAKCSK